MTVQTWTGSHEQNTESFRIRSRDWRIRWQLTAQGDPKFVNFFGWVRKENGDSFESFSGDQVDTILSTRLRGAGTYYLELNIANAAYAVTVEELR